MLQQRTPYEHNSNSKNILRDISHNSIILPVESAHQSEKRKQRYSIIGNPDEAELDQAEKSWNFMHPRYRVVTQADNIQRKEQEYIQKMRTRSHLSEKAFVEGRKSGAASLRWQDSVQNFNHVRKSQSVGSS